MASKFMKELSIKTSGFRKADRKVKKLALEIERLTDAIDELCSTIGDIKFDKEYKSK